MNGNFLERPLHSPGCFEGDELRWSLVLLGVWNRAWALLFSFFHKGNISICFVLAAVCNENLMSDWLGCFCLDTLVRE